MRRQSDKRREEAQINITPMLDVVFILLIFFLVTTSFVKETAIDLTSQINKNTQPIDKKEIILVEIDAKGSIFVDGRQHDFRVLRTAIQLALAADPARPVVLMADSEAGTGVLVRTVDQARAAGATQVSLAARQDAL